eukprot:TRINITY_DN272_c0_g1_i2.p1 TRINITY_DN272_c0_g1~~TRINITY_DN272_c0_g1_i2.p1  ORF type:complete len:285 (-),score=140.13 TRINITY_DN272_c0_g1_i2:329-1183(-)
MDSLTLKITHNNDTRKISCPLDGIYDAVAERFDKEGGQLWYKDHKIGLDEIQELAARTTKVLKLELRYEDLTTEDSTEHDILEEDPKLLKQQAKAAREAAKAAKNESMQAEKLAKQEAKAAKQAEKAVMQAEKKAAKQAEKAATAAEATPLSAEDIALDVAVDTPLPTAREVYSKLQEMIGAISTNTGLPIQMHDAGASDAELIQMLNSLHECLPCPLKRFAVKKIGLRKFEEPVPEPNQEWDMMVEDLKDMGFASEDENRRAVQEANGDLKQAIKTLVQASRQ